MTHKASAGCYNSGCRLPECGAAKTAANNRTKERRRKEELEGKVRVKPVPVSNLEGDSIFVGARQSTYEDEPFYLIRVHEKEVHSPQSEIPFERKAFDPELARIRAAAAAL